MVTVAGRMCDLLLVKLPAWEFLVNDMNLVHK